jgi:hypothetical protein
MLINGIRRRFVAKSFDIGRMEIPQCSEP